MPDGRRYLTIFNNEGNMRSIRYGDQICRDANARAKITLKEAGEIRCIKRSSDEVRLEKVDDKTYYVDVPATGFVILQY